MKTRSAVLAAMVSIPVLASGCSSSGDIAQMNLLQVPPVKIQSYPWRTTTHHKPGGGFQNIWGPYEEPSGLSSAGWIMSRSWRSEKFEPTAFRKIEPAELTVPYKSYRAAWLGQASVLIQSGGKTILTDPLFGERASPMSFAGPARLVGVPLAYDRLPALDVVVISHNHYDHLSSSAISLLAKRYDPIFLVPLGLGELVKGWGASNIVELDWWQYVEVAGHRFSATPVQHFSSRSAFDRNATLWTGWFIEERKKGKRGNTFYFGGDTGYGPFFKETRERLGKPDLALMPIGAYMPRWFMSIIHVNPAEAYRAFKDLEADYMMPIHWGTYDLADEPLDRPIAELRELAGNEKNVLAELPVGGVFEP